MSLGSTVTSLFKVIFLLLLIIVIALGGLYWFDHLELIDYRRIMGPLVVYLPDFMQRGERVVEDADLLEREMLLKNEQVIAAREQTLAQSIKELEALELTLEEREAKLEEEAKRLEEEKNLLSEKQREYDNYKDGIRKQAEYFTGMPPEAAVERLAQMDDLLVIDILRQIDRNAEESGTLSIVPYFLSLMNPEKAVAIQRKMTKVGGYEG